MYNNLNNSFYDEGVRNNKNELSYNNDLTFKSIRLESPRKSAGSRWTTETVDGIHYNRWKQRVNIEPDDLPAVRKPEARKERNDLGSSRPFDESQKLDDEDEGSCLQYLKENFHYYLCSLILIIALVIAAVLLIRCHNPKKEKQQVRFTVRSISGTTSLSPPSGDSLNSNLSAQSFIESTLATFVTTVLPSVSSTMSSTTTRESTTTIKPTTTTVTSSTTSTYSTTGTSTTITTSIKTTTTSETTTTITTTTTTISTLNLKTSTPFSPFLSDSEQTTREDYFPFFRNRRQVNANTNKENMTKDDLYNVTSNKKLEDDSIGNLNLNDNQSKSDDEDSDLLTDTCILPLVAVILSSVALAITLIIVLITLVNIITSE